MRPARKTVLVAIGAGAAVLATSAWSRNTAPPAIVGGPLQTAVMETEAFSGPNAPAAFARVRSAGATVVRLGLSWNGVVGARPPADPTNPDDPAYDWHPIDQQVTEAVAAGLQPILSVVQAPPFAEKGTDASALAQGISRPNPVAYAAFAEAAAKHFGGDDGLPRVSLWQAWNEPNISLFLVPQFNGKKPYSPGLYRRMLNGFYDAVKSVHSDNVVIAGGLAPFRDITPGVQVVDKDWGPMSFMRQLLCLSRTLKPTCHDQVKFDVWSNHPYTSGGPVHKAILPDDVSLGDLGKVRAALNAAAAAGHIVAPSGIRFWITEFAWDSNPPDPQGVPLALLRRWVSDGLYQMWLNGVSLVTWLNVRDQPMAKSVLQCGLWFRGATFADDRPKPILQAFRFPFVAIGTHGGVQIWGRTPTTAGGTVVLQQRDGPRWRTLETVPANSYGIFKATIRKVSNGSFRARFGREASLPFSSRPVPDLPVHPFGESGLEPSRR